MNTNRLKRFAQAARKKLLDQVSSRLELILNTDSAELREKAGALSNLKQAINSSSKPQLIDKVAYTWFNRLMALRFMDTNDYQPLGVRIVTPKDGFTLPEILEDTKQGQIPEELKVNRQHIHDLLDGKIPSSNAQNEVYKELLIGACNHLHSIFPFLFERIDDYTELLLPDDLTSEFSIINDFVEGMEQEDCEEVEVIGWLYQFYISERKDEVFASKSKVKKEDIPAATQLFTPRWIVEYMVQNTVGKLWLQNNPNSSLRNHMPYFKESPSVTAEDCLKVNSVEEITLLDQACGSGHILVYGFELLSKIYEEEGYNASEIPQLIIEKNLYGFEIDERAAQLAGFALMMKAREYHRRAFRKKIVPNILCFEDVSFSKEELMQVLVKTFLDKSNEFQRDLKLLENATNFGSLIIPETSPEFLKKAYDQIEESLKRADVFEQELLERLKIAVNQLYLLSRKYHSVVDNPPYMGSGNMNKSLADYTLAFYPLSKGDLMTCFMEAGLKSLQKNGFLGMINLPAWMFLSTYKKFRKNLLSTSRFVSFLHLGRGIFGSDFGSVSFVIKKNENCPEAAIFRKLFDNHVEVRSQNHIKELFLDNECGYYKIDQNDFLKLPNYPLAYWADKNLIEVFSTSKTTINDVASPRQGLATADNNQFTRFWFEVELNKIGFGHSSETSIDSNKKWFPYNKGGEFRKWYGNQLLVVNWENNGEAIKNDKLDKLKRGLCLPSNSKPKNVDFYFKESISWSKVTAGGLSLRYFEEGFVFDVAGCSIFSETSDLFFLMGLLNSNLKIPLIGSLSPTVNYEVGTIKALPLIPDIWLIKEEVNSIVQENISIAQEDWRSIEIAFQYSHNPVIQFSPEGRIESGIRSYEDYWIGKIEQTRKNEEKLNYIFLKKYNLQSSYPTAVNLKDITLQLDYSKKKKEIQFLRKKLIIDFINYSVGCFFGRYSLNKEGIILGKQGETIEDYFLYLEKDSSEVEFIPDEDNIIPVLEDDWFQDDIAGKFYQFLKVAFGDQHLEKNVAFIEEYLGQDLRQYFLQTYYSDHIKIYKKRPIYWMFSSPKGSFNVLIYMHRYTPDTLNQILNGYLVEYREKLKSRIEHLDHIIVTGSSTEQTKAGKEKDKLKVVLLELQEYEREILYPLATERISIDLDDGVLVNYNKFGKAIQEVKGLNDSKTKKKVRGFDWIDTEKII